MYATFITDFVSVIILTIALYLFWKERSRFRSVSIFVPAIGLLIISHLLDMLTEQPTFRLSQSFHFPPGYLETILGTAGNLADAVSFSLLIYGFIRVLRFKESRDIHIQELEQLLPICSNCKKYRTEDGEWRQIEEFFDRRGGLKLTHGICPDCFGNLYGDVLGRSKSQQGNA